MKNRVMAAGEHQRRRHDARGIWHWPSRDAVRVYGSYAAGIGVLFVLVYGGANWLAERREATLRLYLQAELWIPLVPAMIWAYLSINALFLLPLLRLPPEALRALGRQMIGATIIAGVVFVVFPTTAGFIRATSSSHFAPVFQVLYALDYPHNCVPSLHVTFSSQIILAVARREGRVARALLGFWMLLIAASTLLTHQHHLLDIAAGLLLAAATRAAIAEDAVSTVAPRLSSPIDAKTAGAEP